ncbi:MAG: hypothetical protein ABI178_07320 [Rhodanobacter sp.]
MIIKTRKACRLLFVLALAAAPAIGAAPRHDLPATPIRPVTNTCFGRTVVDNYQWLEQQKSPEVVAWMKAQAAATRAALDSMPGRAKFSAEMQHYLDAQPYMIGDLEMAGDLVFYRKRSRGVNQKTLWVRPAAGGAEREESPLASNPKAASDPADVHTSAVGIIPMLKASTGLA